MKNNILDEKYEQLLNIIKTNISNEEKLKYLNNFKQDVLTHKNTGKKIIKTIDGKKVKVSKKYFGKYYQAYLLFIKSSSKKTDIPQNIIDDNTSLMKELISLKPYIKKSKYLEEEYNTLCTKLSNEPDKNELIRTFISNNLITINFLKSNKPVISNIKDMETKDLVGIDDYSLKIKNIKKPKRKNKLKMFIKILASSLSALFIISGTSFLTNRDTVKIEKNTSKIEKTEQRKNIIKSKSPKAKLSISVVDKITRKYIRGSYLEIKNKNNKTINKIISTGRKITINNLEKGSYTLKEIKTTKGYNKASDIEFNILNKNVDITIENTKIPKSKYDLNTNFTIKQDRSIYTNLQDSVSKNNGYQMYFKNTTNRKTMGYGIKYNNKYITIIKKEDNNYIIKDNDIESYITKKEANKYLKKIIKKGGVIKSIISHSDESTEKNSIEGFYNIKDIKVKVR